MSFRSCHDVHNTDHLPPIWQNMRSTALICNLSSHCHRHRSTRSLLLRLKLLESPLDRCCNNACGSANYVVQYRLYFSSRVLSVMYLEHIRSQYHHVQVDNIIAIIVVRRRNGDLRHEVRRCFEIASMLVRRLLATKAEADTIDWVCFLKAVALVVIVLASRASLSV